MHARALKIHHIYFEMTKDFQFTSVQMRRFSNRHFSHFQPVDTKIDVKRLHKQSVQGQLILEFGKSYLHPPWVKVPHISTSISVDMTSSVTSSMADHFSTTSRNPDTRSDSLPQIAVISQYFRYSNDCKPFPILLWVVTVFLGPFLFLSHPNPNPLRLAVLIKWRMPFIDVHFAKTDKKSPFPSVY